jgi:hypothetical protein
MVHDAEIHAEDDCKRREQVDTKNNADLLVTLGDFDHE